LQFYEIREEVQKRLIGNLTGDDQVETLFMKELRRRGMSSKEKDGVPLGSAGTETKTKEENEEGGGFFGRWSLPGAAGNNAPPQLTESQRDEQLKRSQALNSEGLDVRICTFLASSYLIFVVPYSTSSCVIMAFFSLHTLATCLDGTL
jgi:hypothetical protein